MIWIASLIGGWIIFSAIVVLAACVSNARRREVGKLAERPVRVRSSAPAAGSVAR